MYEPGADSYLLKNNIEAYLDDVEKTLEMGVGSGVLLDAFDGVDEVVAVDVSHDVIDMLEKEYEDVSFVQSDLFQNVEGLFDLITFNPPYLPGDYEEDEELLGGENGVELSQRFLKASVDHLKSEGVILLIASSRSDLDRLEETGKDIGYSFSIIDKKHVFFEDIILYEIRWK